MKKVGAIWVNKTKDGKAYMSIRIGKYKYVAFKNENRTDDKQPIYEIYLTSQTKGKRNGFRRKKARN